MNPDRRPFSCFRINLAIVLFLLGLMVMPAAVRAQTGWHPQTLPPLEQGVTYAFRDVKALSGTEAWIAGRLSNGEAVVLKTLDGGTWSLMFRRGEDSTDPWQRFWEFGRLSVVDSNNAWAAGSFGLTAFTADGGATWSHGGTLCGTGPGGTPQHNYGIKAVSAANVWTTGWLWDQAMGQIWHRPYTGDCATWGWWPWRLEAQYGYATVLAIDAADADNAWAVGYPGILHTTNGGDSWVTEAPSPGGLLADVAVVSPSVAWAVGAGGLILKTVDAGTHWVVQGSGVAANLRKISAVSADVAWVVGDNGTISKTIDGGATWRSQVSGVSDTNPQVNLVGIAAVDGNTAWAVSDRQVLLHVTDGGVYQPLSAPAVSGLSPAGGPVAGGSESVFVGGRDFRPGARVYFDGIPAVSTEYRSSWELMVTTPAHAAGIVDVTVINPDGQSGTRAKAFAFVDTMPLIISLSPSYGYVDTQTELDIFGAGLTPDESSYEPVPTVNINGTGVPGVYASYNQVRVVFVRSLLTAAGMADVTVTTAAGTSNSLRFAVNHGSASVDRPYTPPHDKSVALQSLSGPIQVTFYGLTWNGWVKAGKVFESPEWLGGSWAPGGYSFLPDYYYDVTNYSSMHYQAATICFPYADDDVAAGLNESRLRLLRYVDYSTPWEDVTISLDTAANVICGTTAGLMTYFALAQGPVTPPPPVITGIEPTISPPAGGSTVTINGSRFPANATVTFGGVAATNVTVVNGIKITAQTPAHALGLVDVMVSSPGGPSGVFTDGFEYVGAPTVISLTPPSGHYDTEVTITGTGFRNGCAITFGGQTTGAAVLTDTTITTYAPSHTPGLVDVVVANVDGQSATLANAFTYVPAPTLAYLEPNAGPVEGGTAVTIKGTGFQTGAIVTFDSTEATGVVVVNPTTIAAVTPAHTEGAVYVTVTNPDDQNISSCGGFTYGKSPSIITWANPASIPYGTKLSAAQLNATANVEGTFNYSPAAGTTPTVGTKILTVYFTPTDTDTYTQAQKNVSLIVLPLQGDVNADGAVNVRDAIVVLQVLSGKAPSQAVYASADADGDGAIGLADAIFILQKAASIR